MNVKNSNVLGRNLSYTSSSSTMTNKSGDQASIPHGLCDYSSSSEISCDTVIFAKNQNSYKNQQQPLSSQQKSTNRPSRIKLGISTYKYRSSSSGSSSSISTVTNQNYNIKQSPTLSSSSSSSTSIQNRSPQISKEIWIDGPNNFINTPPPPAPFNTLQTTKTSNNSKNKLNILTPPDGINLNEIWIDGPYSNNSKSKKQPHQPVDNLHLINKYFDTIKDANNQPPMENNLKSDSFESLECLDRELLRQLNEQDMDIIDTVYKLDSNSRPISLLSVNSNDTATTSNTTSTTTSNSLMLNSNNDPNAQYNPNESQHSIQQKLQDLKTSYDQMIFKQSYKQMESLHKTLESFLNLDQSSKFKLRMKQINSTMLAPANDLKSNCFLLKSTVNDQQKLNQNRTSSPSHVIPERERSRDLNGLDSLKNDLLAMSDREKDKRLSRILSPTRFRPAPQIPQQIVLDPTNILPTSDIVSNNENQSAASPAGSSSSSSTLSSSSPSSSSSCSSSSSSSPAASSIMSSSSTYDRKLQSVNYSVPMPLQSTPNSNINTSYYSTSSCLTNSLNSNNNSMNQYAEPFDNINTSLNCQQKMVKKVNSTNSNRLFFNFNNNSNGISLPSSPAHAPLNQSPMRFNNVGNGFATNKRIINLNSADNSSYSSGSSSTSSSSVSVPSTPRVNRKQNHHQPQQQPVLKILKQTANLLTGSVANSVGVCGGAGVNSTNSVGKCPKDAYTPVSTPSILNRLFNRSKSKDKLRLNQDIGSLMTNSNFNRSNEYSYDNSRAIHNSTTALNDYLTCSSSSSASSYTSGNRRLDSYSSPIRASQTKIVMQQQQQQQQQTRPKITISNTGKKC